MFTDLIKGAAKNTKKGSDYSMEKADDKITDERLDEIMAELFGGGGSEDEAPAQGKKAKKGAMPRADLLRAMNEEEDEDEMEEMEKALDKKERREMMSRVYSMVDDLSDEELDQFLSSRDIKKAQAMAVFHQMSNNDLKDFMSVSAANGEGVHEAISMDKGHGYMSMDKGDEAGAMDNLDDEFED